MYQTIETLEKFDGRVLEIRLKTPPANILSAKMIGEISSCLEREKGDPRRKAILFTAEGKHFSFGASVEEHLPEQVGKMLPAFHGLMIQLMEYPILTVSRVSGLCLGGAFELVLCTNMILADETAQFGVPEIQLGVFPPVAAALVETCGQPSFLTEMIVTGEKYPARTLCERGLVSRVVAAGALDTAVSEMLEKQILPKSASSLRIALRAASLGVTRGFAARVRELEKLYLNELMRTEDAQEGIRAFVAKRPAAWRDQ